MQRPIVIAVGITLALLVLYIIFRYRAPKREPVEVNLSSIDSEPLIEEGRVRFDLSKNQVKIIDDQYSSSDYHSQAPGSWPVHSTPTTQLYKQKYHGYGDLGETDYVIPEHQKVAIPGVPRDFTRTHSRY